MLNHFSDLTADQFHYQFCKFGKPLSDDFKQVIESVNKEKEVIWKIKCSKEDIFLLYEEVYLIKCEDEGLDADSTKSCSMTYVNIEPKVSTGAGRIAYGAKRKSAASSSQTPKKKVKKSSTRKHETEEMMDASDVDDDDKTKDADYKP